MTPALHTIKAWLYDNPLTRDNPNDYIARVRSDRSLSISDICQLAETGATIIQVVDIKTGSINDLLTPNRNLKISGHNIRVEGKNEENGVYFIHRDTQERTKVDASDIVTNKPSELVVVIPELAAGAYQLEVTTQSGAHSKSPLKEPRSAFFDRILTVPEFASA
jgi:hypothetical protein